jgi:Xaa-Pro aminopeptidase
LLLVQRHRSRPFSQKFDQGFEIGVDVPLEPGMVFHVPITLREYNKFTVAVSETVIVTEKAAKTYSTISRDLVQA